MLLILTDEVCVAAKNELLCNMIYRVWLCLSVILNITCGRHLVMQLFLLCF